MSYDCHKTILHNCNSPHEDTPQAQGAAPLSDAEWLRGYARHYPFVKRGDYEKLVGAAATIDKLQAQAASLEEQMQEIESHVRRGDIEGAKHHLAPQAGTFTIDKLQAQAVTFTKRETEDWEYEPQAVTDAMIKAAWQTDERMKVLGYENSRKAIEAALAAQKEEVCTVCQGQCKQKGRHA